MRETFMVLDRKPKKDNMFLLVCALFTWRLTPWADWFNGGGRMFDRKRDNIQGVWLSSCTTRQPPGVVTHATPEQAASHSPGATHQPHVPHNVTFPRLPQHEHRKRGRQRQRGKGQQTGLTQRKNQGSNKSVQKGYKMEAENENLCFQATSPEGVSPKEQY